MSQKCKKIEEFISFTENGEFKYSVITIKLKRKLLIKYVLECFPKCNTNAIHYIRNHVKF